MKQKLKCYLAYTTFIYRIVGVVLIPCAFWLACVIMLWSKYGGFMGAGESDSVGMYVLYFPLSVYVVLYEIFTDFWVLGGCLSDAGRELRYFKTSRSGVEVMKNIASVDLLRRFLCCMIFSATIFVFTGWKTAIVMGLAMYCVIVGILNGSRHIDGFQWHMVISFLAQIGMTVINIVNATLIDIAGDREQVMLLCLAVLYCVAALLVSKVMVRRITVRIQKD